MKKENIHFRATEGLKVRIKKGCDHLGLTITQFTIQAINELLERIGIK